MSTFKESAQREAAKYQHMITPSRRHKYDFGCGANKEGGGGFQPGNSCGGDGDGKDDSGDQGGGDNGDTQPSGDEWNEEAIDGLWDQLQGGVDADVIDGPLEDKIREYINAGQYEDAQRELGSSEIEEATAQDGPDVDAQMEEVDDLVHRAILEYEAGEDLEVVVEDYIIDGDLEGAKRYVENFIENAEIELNEGMAADEAAADAELRGLDHGEVLKDREEHDANLDALTNRLDMMWNEGQISKGAVDAIQKSLNEGNLDIAEGLMDSNVKAAEGIDLDDLDMDAEHEKIDDLLAAADQYHPDIDELEDKVLDMVGGGDTEGAKEYLENYIAEQEDAMALHDPSSELDPTEQAEMRELLGQGGASVNDMEEADDAIEKAFDLGNPQILQSNWDSLTPGQQQGIKEEAEESVARKLTDIDATGIYQDFLSVSEGGERWGLVELETFIQNGDWILAEEALVDIQEHMHENAEWAGLSSSDVERLTDGVVDGITEAYVGGMGAPSAPPMDDPPMDDDTGVNKGRPYEALITKSGFDEFVSNNSDDDVDDLLTDLAITVDGHMDNITTTFGSAVAQSLDTAVNDGDLGAVEDLLRNMGQALSTQAEEALKDLQIDMEDVWRMATGQDDRPGATAPDKDTPQGTMSDTQKVIDSMFDGEMDVDVTPLIGADDTVMGQALGAAFISSVGQSPFPSSFANIVDNVLSTEQSGKLSGLISDSLHDGGVYDVLGDYFEKEDVSFLMDSVSRMSGADILTTVDHWGEQIEEVEESTVVTAEQDEWMKGAMMTLDRVSDVFLESFDTLSKGF